MCKSMNAACPPGPILASVAEDYQSAGVRELRDAYGERLSTERLGPEVVAVSAPGLTVTRLAADCRSRPLVFVRHLTQEVGRLAGSGTADLMTVHRFVLGLLLAQEGTNSCVSLHTWSTGRLTVPYGPADLARGLTAELVDRGWSVDPIAAGHVLSICLTPRGAFVGFTAKQRGLSDWPGGRIRLARSRQQISRAEFKLEELLEVSGLRLPVRGRALDLGAAPGGWTRVLRQAGLRVTAVDPGELAERLLQDPEVRHERTTAGEYLRRCSTSFDVVVNDMRMDPSRSSDVMAEAARKLRRGGLAIMTLKITRYEPLAVVQSAMRMLRGQYRIVFARQLHHNRNEITVVGRPGGSRT